MKFTVFADSAAANNSANWLYNSVYAVFQSWFCWILFLSLGNYFMDRSGTKGFLCISQDYKLSLPQSPLPLSLFFIIALLCSIFFLHISSQFVPSIFTHFLFVNLFRQLYVSSLFSVASHIIPIWIKPRQRQLGRMVQFIACPSRSSAFTIETEYPAVPQSSRWSVFYLASMLLADHVQKDSNVHRSWPQDSAKFPWLKRWWHLGGVCVTDSFCYLTLTARACVHSSRDCVLWVASIRHTKAIEVNPAQMETFDALDGNHV